MPADRGSQSRPGLCLPRSCSPNLSAILVYSAAGPAAAVASSAPPFRRREIPEFVGMLLYTDYLVPFELASMLLLVAMVGAILLARKDM